ncbi:MAG: membrane lipoprotein lipid attachment site-containing protein, partial [Spirochaetales bacterium]|nr:membrane lipoprotein lipid attachment site-containing protein [Spirochaetales bacterium]
MDKAKKIIFGAVLLVLLASCSQVFEAGISGKVVTPRGTSTAAVADVNVFAYTDKGRRDSDFAKFQSGTITRPTEGAGYVATTSTNANG